MTNRRPNNPAVTFSDMEPAKSKAAGMDVLVLRNSAWQKSVEKMDDSNLFAKEHKGVCGIMK